MWQKICEATILSLTLEFPIRIVYRNLRLVAILLVSICFVGMLAQTPRQNSLLLGTAWYPEQWPEERWDADLSLMEQAHIHVVRVGEFAWSSMEPAEGVFRFEWLDQAIALAAKHHIAVVLGTPTAAPPAWLTTKYPETLRVDEDGKRAEHGNRQQFSFSDPVYRRFAAQIARKMAEYFGHNPDLLGWQLDNELAAPSFDANAKQQFHRWLQKKYGSIAELNRRWTTAYWSQTYDNFDEIPVHSKGENPALLLDWKRFVTDTWISYLQVQIDAIRPNILPAQFITTNTMHWNEGFDHYLLHKHLDIAAWDDYFPDGHLDPVLNAAEHDLVRGYKQRNFWLMETQPAFVNWGSVNSPLPRGVTREMAWQAVGHGADAVLYWQWRSALNGQEQYHGTMLGADGLPVPVYQEIEQVGTEFDRIGNVFSNSTPEAQVAILQSYDSRWAIDFQRHSQKFDYVTQITDVYKALQPLAQTIDIVSPDADLTRYKVVFAPALNVLSDATAKKLVTYCSDGGHLVLGPRSGMKDFDDALQTERQPGPLAAALGGHVDQYYALEKPVPVDEIDTSEAHGMATVWAESLVPTASDATVVLRYGKTADGWVDHQAAGISRHVGKGSMTYVGATLDSELMSSFVARILDDAGIAPILPGLPSNVELMQRVKPSGSRVWILINHGVAPEHIGLPRELKDMLTGMAGRFIDLPAHGVAVYSLEGVQ